MADLGAPGPGDKTPASFNSGDGEVFDEWR